MKQKDVELFWKEDGDLELMKSYFQQIKTDIDQKERIKKMTLEKIAKDETVPIIETPRLKVSQHLRSWHWRFGWKLAVPAALILLVFFGVWGLSEPLNPKTAQSKNTSTEIASTSQAAPSAKTPSLSDQATGPDLSMNDTQDSSGSSPQDSSTGFTAENIAPPVKGELNGDAASIAPAPGSVPPEAGNESPSADAASIAPALKSVPPEAGNESPPADAASIAPALRSVPPEPGNEAQPAVSSLPKKITYNLDLSLRVGDVSKILDQIRQQVGQVNGYIIDSQQNGEDVNSYGKITVKVPADHLNSFRTYLENLGTVLNSYTSSNDITNQYYDTQTCLTNWEAQEQQYLEILKQDKTADEILQVENQLNDVKQQIESLEGQIKLWNNEVDYPRFQVNLEK